MKSVLHIQKVTGIAGSENHLLNLLPRLDRRKFDITFLLLVETDNPVSEYVELLEAKGVQTARVKIRVDIDPICLWEVYRFIRDGTFDMVHTHLIHGDIYGMVAAKLARVPHVVSTKHGYTMPGLKARFYRLNGFLARYADRVITISDALQEHKALVEGIPHKKMNTIYYALSDMPPLDPSLSNIIREDLDLPEQPTVAIVVGRLIKVKGHKFLLTALRKVLDTGREIFLLIVGDGPLRTDLEELANALNLNRHAMFLGFRIDVWHLLQASDLFVLPTLGEGFGLAVLEAMAAGKPVIASAVTSIPEIVVGGHTGILVPPRDVQALVNALCLMIDEPKKAIRMGQAGRRRAIEEFSPSKMVQATQGLYEEIFS